MKRNTNRILTMHAGSLARPPDLREMVLAKSNGQPYDAAALARRLRSAVAEVVQQQIAVGLDSINDGEFSKTNFTNYARERLSGHAEQTSSTHPGRICGIKPTHSRQHVYLWTIELCNIFFIEAFWLMCN